MSFAPRMAIWLSLLALAVPALADTPSPPPTPPTDAAPTTDIKSEAPVASTPERCRVVVLDLKPNGLPDNEAHIPRILTEALADEVTLGSGCAVMTQADVTAMMDLGAAQLACGAESDACLAEIGSALGADFLVSGAVGALADKRIVAARLLDMKAGVVKARAQEQRTNITELDEATRQVGARLFGREATPAVAVDNASSGSSGLFWGGVAVTAVGTAAFLGGGIGAGLQEGTLRTATANKKEDALNTGRILLGVAGAGVVVAAVGVAMLALSGPDGGPEDEGSTPPAPESQP